MPFEHYDRRIHRPDTPTTVGIHAGGSMAIHAASYRALGEPPYALLHFDNRTGLIGIEPVWDRTMASYALLQGRNYGGARITMRAFLSFLGIDWRIGRKLHAVVGTTRLVVDPSQPADLPLNPERFLHGSFQLFDERRSAIKGDSAATIDPTDGHINLTAAAHELLGKPEHVEMHFDRVLERIGLEAVAAPTESSHRICGTSGHISCRRFLAYWQIDISGTRRFAAHMEDGKLVINLRASSVRAIRRAGVVGITKRAPSHPMLRIVSAQAKAS